MIHILNQDDEIIDYFDINDGTVLEPDLIRNIENLEDTLEFSVATHRSINVQDRNRVIIKDNEGEYREFIIMQYESNLDGFTDVSCVGSHLEDFQTAKPYKPQKLERYTTKEALSFMAADTGWEVAPDNEWNGLRTTSWSSWKDRLSLIKQLQTTYDMRLSFYVELGTNSVKHRYVKLVEVNPMFNGEEIVYGENMIDLKRTVDFTDVATALIAIGPEYDDGNRLIIEEVDNDAQMQLGLPYRYLWQIYEPESDDQNMTEARLRTLARTKLNKIKTASVEYTIQSTQLNVKVGDMIRVKNEDFTPELYVEAEVIEIKYNAYTKLCDYKFGILTEYTRAEVYERFNALLETLRERLNNIKYDTENVINERLEKELAGLERYIEKSPYPPLDAQEGDLWLDTSHDQVAVLKRYENGVWVKSSVTEAHEVNAPTKEEALYTMLQERKNRLNNDFISNYGLFNTLTAHKYYDELDADIKNMLFDLFVDQTNKYSTFENDFDYINAEQPTIGLILAAMESALRFENSSNEFKTGYNTARAALDAYLEILRSQYTDEKYLDALNAVADKFGLDVVDGKLLGDANFIENMEDIKTELQQQLDDAKKAFDELEIGARNLLPAFTSDRWTHQNLTEVEDYSLYFPPGHTGNSIIFLDVEKQTNYTMTFNSDYARYYIYEVLEDDSLGKIIRTRTGSETYTFNTEDVSKIRVSLNTFSGNVQEEKNIWNLKLERGTVATDWTPAPEDTNNKITNINQSITNIEGQLQSTVNKDTFDLLNETVTKQGTTIKQTADKLSTKADKSVVDTLSGTVKNHGTQLTQTAAELASKADKSLFDEVSGTVTQQGTLINQNAQEIALRAKTADLNSVTGRVTKAEADIKINAGEISSRVKDVDYQTDKDGIISRLSGAESSISQQSNLIATKVSSTELTQVVDAAEKSAKDYTDTEIDNVEIGGRNLIPNSNEFSRLKRHDSRILVLKEGQKVEEWNTEEATYIEAETTAGNTTILTNNAQGTTGLVGVWSIYVKNMGDSNITISTNGLTTSIVNVAPGEAKRAVFKGTARTSYDFIQLYFANDGILKAYLYGEQLEFGNKVTAYSPAPEDTDAKIKANENRIIKHDTKFEQTDTQLSLKATMSDVNQSDKTLSQAISELVIDSTNGLKFNYDSNGRLASYSVGRDGIQFDGSKIKFTASDSIMLQINAAKKAGDDAKAQADAARVGNNIAASLNLSGTTTKISGSKIELVGDVDIVNGKTTISNAGITNLTGSNAFINNLNALDLSARRIYSQNGEHELNIEGGFMTITRDDNARMDMNINGIAMYNSNGSLRFSMDAGLITSSALGTSNLNVYLAPMDSGEVRMIKNSTLGGTGDASDYSYVPTRTNQLRAPQGANMYLSSDLEIRATAIYDTSIYRDIRANGFKGNFVEINDFTDGEFFYVRALGEVRATSPNTRDNYIDFRARDIYNRAVITTTANGYFGVDNELRIVNKGLSGIYRDVRAAGYYGTFLETTATNMYVRASGEVRITNKGTTGDYKDIRVNQLHTTGGFQHHSSANFLYFGVGGATGMRITNNNLYNGGNIGWRDIEFRNWKANSHEKYKKDIKEWNVNVLDIFKNELQLYQYKYRDNLENNMIHRGIVLREDSTHDKFPAEWRQDDGYNGNEVMWWTVKGVQELAQDNYKKDEIIKEQGTKIEELEKQMSEVMQLLKNK